MKQFFCDESNFLWYTNTKEECMAIRRRTLPAGWYPATEAETREMLTQWQLSCGTAVNDGVACIVPHAGWFFSGRLAFSTISHLKRDAETVVVVGGHLAPHENIKAYTEEEFETPLGNLLLDSELFEAISQIVDPEIDRRSDNTVEIQLPIIRYLFPHARVCCFRAAPSTVAEKLGRAIYRAAETLKRNVVVVGSTDLTHYGPNYGFMPYGSGRKAYEWVRDVNDRRIIDAFLSCDTDAVLSCASKDQSACSAGGAVAAMEFGRLVLGCGDKQQATGSIPRAVLVGYLNSHDIYAEESFVGYAGIVYVPQK